MRGTVQRVIPSLLVVVFLLFTGTPPSTADGGLADCGLEAHPCEIEPGTHEGTLESLFNERDYYSFTPPEEPASIQIEVHTDSETVEAVLRDPQGRTRGEANNRPLFFPFEVGAVAQPHGTWTLEIGYGHVFGDGLSDQTDYTFSLEWIHFEHVEQFDLESGNAPSVGFRLDGEAHVEVLHQPGTDNEDPTAFQSLIRLRSEGHGFVYTYTSTSRSYPGSDTLKTWGKEPGDLHVGLGTYVGSPNTYPLDVHNPEPVPATVDMAYSTSRGIESSTAWIAYNGNTSLLEQREGHAFYHRATDMEGGEGFFAGGYINADGLRVEEHIPSSASHSTSMQVDAHNPQFAEQPTVATVTKPDGKTVTVTDDSLYFWIRESGTWRVEMEHIDGFEGKNLRFYGWSFPLTPW